MKRCSIVAVAFAIFMLAGAASAAPPTPGEFAKRLFAGGITANDKTYACFVRTYDAAHLAKHPEQKVTVMKLLVTGEASPEDDVEYRAQGHLTQYSFRLGLRFRNRSGAYDSSGSCGYPRAAELTPDKLQLFCGVDCDGGGITVEMANNDKSTLIRLESIRIWRDNKPDDEGFTISGGADDRVFRLDRAKLDECRALITDRAELSAIRRK